jgi:hypothetical protein
MYSKTVAPDLALIEAAERASETDAPQDTIVLYGSAAGTSFQYAPERFCKSLRFYFFWRRDQHNRLRSGEVSLDIHKLQVKHY